MRFVLPILALAVLLGGCDDDTTAPRDVHPPAAPRGFYSVTGDHQVRLSWLANTEGDVAGYRVYMADCPSGSSCPYTRIGSTAGTTFTVDGLSNGVTRYFAIAAYDYAGNESDLTYADVPDTPRPAGAFTLTSTQSNASQSGWDFSAFTRVSSGSPNVDIVFSDDGATYEMIAPFTDTDIQDAGWATSLDAVDFAPNSGWSPTGRVELIQGHCYVVWTRDNNYAKFRVTGVGPGLVTADWAYQTDTGNPELGARRPVSEEGRVRRPGLVSAR